MDQLIPSILCIDTALQGCSVAVATPEGLLYHQIYEGDERSNASLIGGYTERALRWIEGESRLRLAAIAVTDGPGSYTGLRIGASMAKGLAFGYQIPLIAVSTLEIIWRSQQPHEGDSLVLLEAGHGNVYAQTFTAEGISLDAPHFVASDGWNIEELERHEGLRVLHRGALPDILVGGRLDTRAADPISAVDLGRAALRHWAREAWVDTAYWEPNYVKPYEVVIGRNKVLDRLRISSNQSDN